jgi:hypothetical protein
VKRIVEKVKIKIRIYKNRIEEKKIEKEREREKRISSLAESDQFKLDGIKQTDVCVYVYVQRHRAVKCYFRRTKNNNTTQTHEQARLLDGMPNKRSS